MKRGHSAQVRLTGAELAAIEAVAGDRGIGTALRELALEAAAQRKRGKGRKR